MRINTSQFEAAHGRKPRGQGLWFFELVTAAGRKSCACNGTYTEASRHARRQAGHVGATEIVVGS